MRALYTAVLISALVAQVHAQGNALSEKQQPDRGMVSLAMKVEAFQLRQGTILDGIAQLTGIVPQLSFSFEELLRDSFQAQVVERKRFNLDLHDHTVEEILNELSRADPRYTWTRDSAMINVFPAHAIDAGGSYLLNRLLERLEINEITNAQDAVFAAVKQLPPPFEQIAVAQMGGNVTYPSPWTATLTSITVRQALNAIARQVSPRTGWLLSGAMDFRTITFYSGQLHPIEKRPE